MAISYNPWREINDLAGQVFRAVSSEDRSMAMDLYRSEDVFVVKMDLPGVTPGSIDIDVDDRTLTVRAERTQEPLDTTNEKNVWLTRERSTGTYARQISLGTGLNVAGICADYADGVLTLTIPMAEEAKPRKIEVNTNKAAVDADVVNTNIA
ncbi:MAG: Hsp20/alpha crystallin family protein [Propionibacteriaceae bacterium]|jgi:HSP20 family protein|nr:Hsp20/alpha crystallin family protein [Propionibacteriaceae bacterium]